MKTLFVVTACLSVGLSSVAADEPNWIRPVYKVSRVSATIKIDGKADESSWERAPKIDKFQFPWWKGSQQTEQSEVRMLWDDRRLYILAICKDSHVTGTKRPHDDSKIAKDDCFEIMVAPDPKRPEFYFNIEWNVHGSVIDAHRPMARKGPRVASWNSTGIKIHGTVQGTLNDDSDRDQSWTCEIAIPLTIFDGDGKAKAPRAGDRWNVNLNRHNYLKEKGSLQLSQWSSAGTPKPSFHVPHRFGQLIFDGEAK